MSDTNTSGTEMVDYFSMLPHQLIRHILSFLPFDDVARTCTLSEDWHRIWLSYPNVEFHFDFCAYKGQDFFDHIENSLAECIVRKACIQNFSLSICFPEIEILTPNLDSWLNLAVKKNISELRLSVGRFYGYIYSSLVLYSIPGKVLVANTLEVLDLHQCNLKEDRFGYINLPRLGKLSLNKCQFAGESLLQKIFPSATIEAPALHTLEFSSTMSLSSELKFNSWIVPKLDDIDMIFSVDNFSKACEAGLKEFLMKLHNYKDLKVVIFNNDNFVMVENLHAVSFSFLRNMVRSINILITSRDETRLVQMLGKPVIKVAATIYMMCSSPENAESFYKKLGDHSIIKDKYLLELVSPEEVEQQMNSALIEFVKSNSRVFNHHAAIILHKRTQADLIRRLSRRFAFNNRH
nr:F-box protein At5g03100-like isoform X1 [Ipomoea batatas]GME18589.1 F-box protein At5g03100-like isoform X1 [Ipomoea batatas]